jgi:hypothetical protein
MYGGKIKSVSPTSTFASNPSDWTGSWDLRVIEGGKYAYIPMSATIADNKLVLTRYAQGRQETIILEQTQDKDIFKDTTRPGMQIKLSRNLLMFDAGGGVALIKK